MARCVEWISDRWTGLDVVIPNAGIGYFDPLENAKIEEWHAMVDVNVTGVLNTLHATLPPYWRQRACGEHRLLGRPPGVPQQRHLLRHQAPSWPFLSRSEPSSRASSPSTRPVNTFIDRTTNNELRANYRPQFDVGMTPNTWRRRRCLPSKAEAKASSASSPYVPTQDTDDVR